MKQEGDQEKSKQANKTPQPQMHRHRGFFSRSSSEISSPHHLNSIQFSRRSLGLHHPPHTLRSPWKYRSIRPS